MAICDDPSALRFDYSDNNADAAFLFAEAFSENLSNLNIKGKNERALRRLIAGKTCCDRKAPWDDRHEERGPPGGNFEVSNHKNPLLLWSEMRGIIGLDLSF